MLEILAERLNPNARQVIVSTHVGLGVRDVLGKFASQHQATVLTVPALIEHWKELAPNAEVMSVFQAWKLAPLSPQRIVVLDEHSWRKENAYTRCLGFLAHHPRFICYVSVNRVWFPYHRDAQVIQVGLRHEDTSS